MPKALTPLQIATASSNNQQANLGIIIGESVGMGAMFIMMLKATWRKFLEAHLRKFLFPLAVVCDVTCTCLVWHMLYLKPQDKNLLTRAIIESIGVLIEVAAILMVIFASTVAGMVTPLLLTAATGGKALVNTGLGIFYAVKTAFTDDKTQKGINFMLALECGVQAFCGALITIATAGAILAGKIAFAAFGIVAAVIGVGVCTYKWATLSKPQDLLPKPTDADPAIDNESNLSESAKIAKTLGLQSQKTPEDTITPPAAFVMPTTTRRSVTPGSSNLRFFPDFDLIEFSDDTPEQSPRPTGTDTIQVKRLRGG